MTENVVLGGGIAGISAAYAAKRSGRNATVYEARATAGGLLDNFTIEADPGRFRFDTAVHLSFAWQSEVREVFDQTPYYTHNPESLCWDAGLWLRHPVQNNMSPLPVDEKVELIASLAEAREFEIKNYKDWLINQYGEAIAARWPLVYTDKYWTVPAEQLGTAWIGQRMYRADIRQVLKGAFSTDTPNVFYAKEMRYPKRGGYRAFIEPMIDEVEIVCNHEVVRVDQKLKAVQFANGGEVRYDNLVSTLPLPRLVEMMSDVPAEVGEAASTLFATAVDLISIGFSRPKVSPALWFYIYDREIWAARAYSPDWKSPDNVPEGCSSLQFEIYSSPRNPQQRTPEELKANTVQAVLAMGLAAEDEILFVDHRQAPYANVTFDLGMEERRNLVRGWVESQGIRTAGRFGEWGYLWSNESMMSGVKAAEEAFGLTA